MTALLSRWTTAWIAFAASDGAGPIRYTARSSVVLCPPARPVYEASLVDSLWSDSSGLERSATRRVHFDLNFDNVLPVDFVALEPSQQTDLSP